MAKFLVDLRLDGYNDEAEEAEACFQALQEVEFGSSSIIVKKFGQHENTVLRSMLFDIMNALEPFAKAEQPWMASDENFLELPKLHARIKAEINS